MATGMVAMRTAVGLACSCLIIFLLATGLHSPAPDPNRSRSPSLLQQTTTELGRRSTANRRLLSFNLSTRRLDETAGNSSSPYSQQGNSSYPYSPQGYSSSPDWGTGARATPSSSKPSAIKYVVPIGCSVVSLALVVALVFWWVGRSRRCTPPQLGKPVKDEEMHPPKTNNTQAGDTLPKELTLSDIKRVTNNFRQVLGQGSFGKVYLGKLEGKLIAVKQLTQKELNVSPKDFEREMGILMKVRHRNLVKFLAYCNKGDHRFLCFEYLSGGSLDKQLYASKCNESKKTHVEGDGILLDWGMRYYIVKEVCAGLHYLHVESDSEKKILHMDLKAGNILIDEGGTVVKIADFGISRLLDADKTYEYITNNTHAIGMRAYLPPECFGKKPKISEKVDIYCYGMLLLEMITGWCATDTGFPGAPKFIEMARDALGNRDVKKLLDRTLQEQVEGYSVPQVLNCIGIAFDCLNDAPDRRPGTKQIGERLNSK